MGLLDEQEKMSRLMGLLGAFNVNAGGSNHAAGGRIGFNDVPITDNMSASAGVSGYYLPQQHEGQFNTYDAALNYYLGKQKQHELGVAAEGLNTPDPRYMLNYQYKF